MRIMAKNDKCFWFKSMVLVCLQRNNTAIPEPVKTNSIPDR